MSNSFLKTSIIVLLLVINLHDSEGQLEQWCIADEQNPDSELQAALDWACGKGGADCSKIQLNQSCYYPNTVRDHASYAFNSYYQKFKHKGGRCYFKAAAMTTGLDPRATKSRMKERCKFGVNWSGLVEFEEQRS